MIEPTNALLLRKVDYRESDWVVTLFSERLGKVSALARAARRSRTRFAGSLEPLHTLAVELVEPRRGELFELRSARLERPRQHLALGLDRMNAAGLVLSWVRRAAPERVPEPSVYRALSQCLDRLDHVQPPDIPHCLASAGLDLLAAFGWGLDFDQCVSCGTPCPAGKAAYVSPERGGVVCSRCAPRGVPGSALVSPEQRQRFATTQTGASAELGPEDCSLALRLVERTLLAHANVGGIE